MGLQDIIVGLFNECMQVFRFLVRHGVLPRDLCGPYGESLLISVLQIHDTDPTHTQAFSPCTHDKACICAVHDRVTRNRSSSLARSRKTQAAIRRR